MSSMRTENTPVDEKQMGLIRMPLIVGSRSNVPPILDQLDAETALC